MERSFVKKLEVLLSFKLCYQDDDVARDLKLGEVVLAT